jgi:leucyl-tRNA synthetase
MSERYIPQDIEPKWQARWTADQLYRTAPPDHRPKYYVLDFYPYPSGDGLSVGHARNYVPTDVLARYYRMKGYNVLHPMGFDAFGLPAEDAAIKLKVNPARLIAQYAANYKRQFNLLGLSYDWSRELNSSHPEYYHWTQWIFLQLYHSWYDKRADQARPIAELEAELAEAGTAGLADGQQAPPLSAAQWRAMPARERRAYLMKHFRLAYRGEATVNWDPVARTVVANEEVVDGKSWRSGALVERRVFKQWFFRITAYADRLIDDLQTIDWPERIVAMQSNWIGRSIGAEVVFPVAASPAEIVVFTTRPDTLWGATFMVLAPEHPLVAQVTTGDRRAEVEAYAARAKAESETDRTASEKEKTGVFTGGYAVNPVNGERIPIWIADYVLMGYGTGAIMAVPAHDERDFAFALKFGLPIIPVIDRPDRAARSLVFPGSADDGLRAGLEAAGIPFEAAPVGDLGEGLHVTLRGDAQIDQYIALARRHLKPGSWNAVAGARFAFIFDDGVQELESAAADQRILERCKALYPPARRHRTCMEMLNSLPFCRDVLFHAEYGAMIHSGEFTGAPGDTAREQVTAWLEERGAGKRRVNYKLRDWLISRQRYWGTPIPIIHTPDGEEPLDASELPLKLPPLEHYEPTGTGESPLANATDWVDVPGRGRRETDTMGTFACSSWYFLRFSDPGNDQAPFTKENVSYWLPVDMYVGGAEHAVMHLLYARFWNKVLYDLGCLPFKEPFQRLRNQGLILAPDGKEKMSKSKGNVITPDEVVAEHGADALRGYELFISDFSQPVPWNTNGVPGVRRWLERVWRIALWPDEDRGPQQQFTARSLRRVTHQTIQKVEHDILNFGFNTLVAALMEFTNALYRARDAGLAGSPEWGEAVDALIRLLAPVAPHLAEEIWERLGRPYSVHQQPFPVADAEAAREDTVTIVVQVNGKVRDRVEVEAGADEETVRRAALAADGARRFIGDKTPRQVICVPGRLVNVVL